MPTLPSIFKNQVQMRGSAGKPCNDNHKSAAIANRKRKHPTLPSMPAYEMLLWLCVIVLCLLLDMATER